MWEATHCPAAPLIGVSQPFCLTEGHYISSSQDHMPHPENQVGLGLPTGMKLIALNDQKNTLCFRIQCKQAEDGPSGFRRRARGSVPVQPKHAGIINDEAALANPATPKERSQ